MGRIVGIDLGTTTSEIAYIKNGKPQTVKIESGSAVMPSVVGYDKKNEELLVGNTAKNMLLMSKNGRVVEQIKRKMGTDEVVVLGEKEYTPIDISAEILKKLKKICENEMCENVTGAVITVPANFNDVQRRATIAAGEQAGLKVERIINEPTAAALAFGINNMETEGKILIYDLGGGTFDVTVLEMLDGALDVMTSRGIDKLGGVDFDRLIEKKIHYELRKEYDIDISKDFKAVERIRETAEKTKKILSDVTSTTIALQYLTVKDGELINFEMDITREEFEGMILGYIEETMEMVDNAIKEAGLSVNDIDIVLAVGGSTRIPIVKKMLRDKFGDKVSGGVEQDEAVALGAAVQAGIISKEIAGDDSIMIFDVCSHSLGVACVNDDDTGMEFSRIIMRDTHLPYSKKRTYCTHNDFQKTIEVEVYQGESDNLSFDTPIGSFSVKGIPENYAGKEDVEIEFEYDVNGILQVNVKIVSTGEVTSKVFDMSKHEQPAKRKMNVSKEIEWESCSLAKEVETSMMLYKNRRHKLSEEAKREADKLVEELKKAVINSNADKVRELDDRLTALLLEFI